MFIRDTENDMSNAEEPAPAELIAQGIEEIAASMKRLESSRLNRKAIILLVHAGIPQSAQISKRDVDAVLDSLSNIKADWLKR